MKVVWTAVGKSIPGREVCAEALSWERFGLFGNLKDGHGGWNTVKEGRSRKRYCFKGMRKIFFCGDTFPSFDLSLIVLKNY